MSEQRAEKSQSENKKASVENQATKESTPEEIDAIVKDMPPEVRQTVRMAMMQTFSRGPAVHPLLEKFTAGHIDKVLDYSQEDDKNEFSLRRSNRYFNLSYVIIGLSVFIFLIVFLAPQNIDLLKDILKLLVAFIGGVGSGFGLKTYLEKR